MACHNWQDVPIFIWLAVEIIRRNISASFVKFLIVIRKMSTHNYFRTKQNNSLVDQAQLQDASKVLQNGFTDMKSSHSNLNCTRFQNYVNQKGYSFSDCPAAIGNQLGVLAIELAIYRHFGLKLVLDQRQKSVLKNAFDVDQICRADGTSFCIVRMTGKHPSRFRTS